MRLIPFDQLLRAIRVEYGDFIALVTTPNTEQAWSMPEQVAASTDRGVLPHTQEATMSGTSAASGSETHSADSYAYIDEDLARLIYSKFNFTVMNQERSSVSELRRLARTLEVWGHYLPHYRSVRCEPLDRIYQWLTWVGTIDQPLWDQFMNSGGWHEEVFAAWMTIMRPTPAHRERLERVARTRRNPFAAQLAVHVLDGTAPPQLSEHLELIAFVRGHLYRVPWPMMILRRPNREAMREIAAVVATIYREKGAEAAHAYLRKLAETSSLPLIECTAPTRLVEVGAPPREPWLWGMSV